MTRPAGSAFSVAAMAALCALGAAGAWAQANRFDYDEPAVRLLEYASWEAGTILGSAATPYSRADLRLAYARAAAALNAGAPSPEAELALSAVAALLDERPAWDSLGFSADLGAAAAAEAYLRLYDSGGLASPWGWSERQPLVALPFELYALDLVYARVAAELREEHNAIEREVTPANASNWIESLDYVDYTFPFESFLSAEYGPLSLSLGRDALRWGPGATGTLALSDAPDYYDYVDAGLTGERFSYRFARVSIDPALTASELAALPPSFESRKNLFLHRFELLFGGRVAFALVEGLMVGGVEPDLAYANPFIVLHNRWAWNATHYDGIADNDFTSAAALLSLELRVNPWRYGELYGSFTINQFQTDYERTRYPGAADVIPNAFAWIAGGRGAYPLLGGWARVTAEYVYTNPWMYLRENALNSFTWRRVLPSNMAGADVYASAPLGYRYGPDAQVLYAALGWDAPGRLTLMASLERAVRGQQTIATPYDEGDDSVALKTPTGVPETTTGLGLEAAWYPLPGLSVTATLLWRSVTNAGHVSGAAARALDGCVGIAVSYPEISRRGR